MKPPCPCSAIIPRTDSTGERLVKASLRHALALVFALVLFASSLPAALAQPAAQSPAQSLDMVRASLDRIERSLQRGDLSDNALQALRSEIEPLSEMTAAILKALEPRLEATRARLEQLGKPAGDKPGADATPEAAQAAAERAEQQKLFDELDAMVKRARLHAVQTDQLSDTIVNRRRALFQQALFERSSSLLSPRLWYAAIGELPQDFRAMGVLASDWASLISSRLSGSALRSWLVTNLALALGVFIALVGARRIMGRPKSLLEPTPLQKAYGAVWVAVVTATVPIVAALAFLEIARFHDLINQRLEPLVAAIFDGVRRIAITIGLARGLLAIDRPQWRLLNLETVTAEKISRMVLTIAIIVSLMKVMEAMNDLVAASVAVSVVMRGVGAVTVAIVMASTLYGILAREGEEEDEYGPRISTGRDWYGVWRILAWVAIIAIVISCAIGLIAFASFVLDQLVWVTFVATAGYMLHLLATEAVARAVQPGSVAGRAAMNTVGLARDSLRQIATLLQGALGLVLVITGAMLVLAPWGVESDDMLGTLRAAFFGFRVGDITISLAGILLAIALFTGGIVFTRVLQEWLEDRYLPTTRLDIGLRNSIRTSVGYVGIFLAAAVALSYMGLSFEKLAIVAGALSVGIGFGLQSIVGNFVSGLILLWERVIRVGDLIAVGNDTGHVRRINVRSTEIETSDRVTVIVPNSNLITGVVKNWVRSDRVSRVRVPISVTLTASPEAVRQLLIEVAGEHDLVLDQPEPSVSFVAMTDTALKFELSCYASDVEKASRIKSDLNFAIFARLQEAGIGLAAST
jgi:small-conductance mechanosensitive channel